MAQKEESTVGLLFGIGFCALVVWLIIMGIFVWSHQTTIQVRDFSCSGLNKIDKENCLELAKTYLVTEALRNQSITDILKEVNLK